MPSFSSSRPGRKARSRPSRGAPAAHGPLQGEHVDPEHYWVRKLVPDEVRWVRELWEHREPVDEIADQLDVEVALIERLIVQWRPSEDASSRSS